MTLVARLRACPGAMSDDPECNCLEAAAEIERLLDDLATSERLRDHAVKELGKDSAEVERLRLKLIVIRDAFWSDGETDAERLVDLKEIARAALEPKP